MNYTIKTSYGKGNLQAIKICKEIAQLSPQDGEKVVFDVSQYGENNPLGNLLIINSIRRFKKNYPNAHIQCKVKDQDGYLSHIGFYKACGVSIGKEPGESRASSNYVPITNISLHDSSFYNTIETRARELAATLQFDSGLQNLLKYIFIETIRNTYEHADCKNVWVAAQKWPSHNLVEIAITDSGCGITGSLNKFFATDPINLLRLACKPGISARSNYRYLEKDDPWRNSGYGLYIMKELALAYHGSFILCSGGNAIRYSLNNNMETKEAIFETDYCGTAIGIRFSTDKSNDFEQIRSQIVARGQMLSEKTKGAIRTASRSSGGRYHLDERF